MPLTTPAWPMSTGRVSTRPPFSGGDAPIDRSVPYSRDLVDSYIPNESSLLPPALARQLRAAAFWQEPLPFATQGTRVMQEFLIDLSWSSSRLEGNSYSRQATVALFECPITSMPDPASLSTDALMLFNHRNAIELLVRHARPWGLTRRLVEELHGALMWRLLGDPGSVGRLRNHPVEITCSTYKPCPIPAVLHEMLDHIVAKASVTRNPVEAAFFLWVHLAYLQGFADGNRRTSRLSANVPLLLGNCAPLTFIDVDRSDYAAAMVAVYERRDFSIAVDLFEWLYRRSMRRYLSLIETGPAPDPRAIRYYHPLAAAMRAIVIDRKSAAAAVAEQRLPAAEVAGFTEFLHEEIAALHESNGAVFRLSHELIVSWIASGRPH
ncbi:Fic family protein [Roseateles sp. MS654]|uniref:Fic family protein n=1 Tax=Roseateles sp. MS654 TaxID=3412685 RepID=UPI003C2E3C2F